MPYFKLHIFIRKGSIIMEEAARKKVIVSGIQPSGDLTLGS